MRRVLTFIASVVLTGAAALLAWVSKLPKAPLDVVTVAGSAAALLTAGSSDRIKQEFGRVLDPRNPRSVVLRARFITDKRGRRAPRVRDVGAVDVGVHEAEAINARQFNSAEAVIPPYVTRDAHRWLVNQIHAGGFILIEGRSAAGKTRLAFQAVHEAVPEYRLLIPTDGKALAELAAIGRAPARSVIWLDDLERFLGGDGLTRAVLDRLCPPGTSEVVVLATLRLEERRARTHPVDDLTGHELSQLAEDVLGRARTPNSPLASSLSPPERERARSSTDSRITRALEHSAQDGFGATLCGGPAVVRRFQRAENGETLTGAALVTAAVDARRAGYLAPLPLAALSNLYLLYVPDNDRHRRDLPSLDQAVEWAVAREHGASCLIPRAADTFELFDFLLDHVQRQRAAISIPDQVWDTVAALADPDALLTIGATAYFAGLLPRAENCFRAAAATGNSIAQFNLGVLLKEVGRLPEAEAAYRRAADAGHVDAQYNLGKLLKRGGRLSEAEAVYRRAAESGDTNALYNLGKLLKQDGRESEAEAVYREAAESGHPSALNNLGVLLKGAGRLPEAEEAYRRAADAGNADARYNLGNLLKEEGRAPEAEEAYRRAANLGHVYAQYGLGAILVEAGRLPEAEEAYRRAADAGHLHAQYNLGNVLKELGHLSEAEFAYRRAANAGHADAQYSLGAILVEAGRLSEAEGAFRKAAEAGHLNAQYNLGNLAKEGGRLLEAEAAYRKAAEAGHADAQYNLGKLLKEAGRLYEAEEVYRRAADAGDTDALNNLGVLLKGAGRLSEAEAAYRDAADAGHVDAQYNLGKLLKEAGRVYGAEVAFRQAASAGDADALHSLADLLLEAGRQAEAEGLYLRAASAGDTSVPDRTSATSASRSGAFTMPPAYPNFNPES